MQEMDHLDSRNRACLHIRNASCFPSSLRLAKELFFFLHKINRQHVVILIDGYKSVICNLHYVMFQYSSFMRMRSADFDDNFHVMQLQMYHALFAWWSDLWLAPLPPPPTSPPFCLQPPSTHMSGGGTLCTSKGGWCRRTRCETKQHQASVP